MATTKPLANIKVRFMKTKLITEYSQPSADINDYHLVQDCIALMEGLAKGEAAFSEGRVLSHSQAKERMSKWLKI